MEDKAIFKSGAMRSSRVPRFDLIPREGLRRLAERYTVGAVRYGDNNWKNGANDAEYIAQAKAHLIQHVWDYLETGNATDDNLAAIAWGAFALMEFEYRNNLQDDDREEAGLSRMAGCAQ